MNWAQKLIVKKEIAYMLNYIKKAWPSIVPALGWFVSFLSPSVQAWAAAHPTQAASGTVLMIWQVIVHHLPSPVSK